MKEIEDAVKDLDASVKSEVIGRVSSRISQLKDKVDKASIINENSHTNVYLMCGEKKKWLKKEQIDFRYFAEIKEENPFSGS